MRSSRADEILTFTGANYIQINHAAIAETDQDEPLQPISQLKLPCSLFSIRPTANNNLGCKPNSGKNPATVPSFQSNNLK